MGTAGVMFIFAVPADIWAPASGQNVKAAVNKARQHPKVLLDVRIGFIAGGIYGS
jgi:hypothetical protein